MISVVLISTAALVVAVVGCVVIWRMDIARADEVERDTRTGGEPSTPAVPAHVRPRTRSLPQGRG